MTAAVAAAAFSDGADLDVARTVLGHRGGRPARTRRRLDGRFTRAVDLLSNVTGRVVVSGMGKSGHVARKIAATLASTGTPSLFVHPAEASHGDLGMIVAGDAVLALSNSGRPPNWPTWWPIPADSPCPWWRSPPAPASALADAADVALLLPAAAEACPMGLAPTTSTTMQMALGDALAVALFTRRGFTARRFPPLPPGRQAGRPAAPRARSDARGRRHAVGAARHADGPRLAADDRKALRLPRRLRHGRAAGRHRHGRRPAARHGSGPAVPPPGRNHDPVAAHHRSRRLRRRGAARNERAGAADYRPVRGRCRPRPVGILHIHDLLRAGVA